MNETDQELLEAIRRRDPRALERLLTRHEGRVYNFGLRMCGDEEDAKDILQETLLAAARTVNEFRGASSVSTWLYTIARSFCIKKRRTSKFAPERLESLETVSDEAHEVPDGRRPPDEHVLGSELEAALNAALGALAPKYREVLVLRDVEGLSAAETAEVLGLSVDAVKSRLHRARISLRERIAPLLGRSEPADHLPEDDICPDILQLFSRYLDHEISGPVCAKLERHLRRCTRCRARCDALRASLELCSSAPRGVVPPAIEQSVRTALRRALAPGRRSNAHVERRRGDV